ncbi:MAG TPA: PQQ-like beta-propeller repeat protein [Sedimentisphaerales bacterium]|jgi:outer membrane protein assembly factor BamB|nr:PQQ-like beta-propeller repeat protein [Sedimentisphaerales bacterium]HNU31898.1 PQQ-like beta-propeller repeat protein [Sedimentisphaerales bacterium]
MRTSTNRPSCLLVLCTLSCCCLALVRAKAADWPQWQGPNRDGKSADTGLLKEWPNGGPPLAWRIDKLGGGDSAPAIAAGRVFVMSNRGQEEVVWALSEKDGSEIWVTTLGPAFQQRASQGKEGPACTPTVDDERLYVEGLGGNVACLQVADGKIVWQRSMTEDFGGRVPMWSYRESPLIDGDQVIVTPGGADAILVALNKLTGETIWKAKLPDSPAGGSEAPAGPGGGRGGPGGGAGASYASPIAIDFDGLRQYVQLTARTLIGVAASDGKFLWRYDKPANRMGINCSTALYHEGMVFASSAYGAGCGLVKLTKDADGAVKAEEVYATTDMQNHHGGMILLDGHLYGASGGNEGGALVCLDFQTGKVLWDQRESVGRRAKGSLAFADGMLYYRMEDGTVCLIEPNPTQYTERGRFEQPDRTRLPAWAHPVIANGRLYIRDQDVLFCYDIKA